MGTTLQCPRGDTQTFTDTIYQANGTTPYDISGATRSRLSAAAVVAKWVKSTAYALGDIRKPKRDNGYFYVVTTAGTSNTSEPSWGTTLEGLTTDGATLVWKCLSKYQFQVDAVIPIVPGTDGIATFIPTNDITDQVTAPTELTATPNAVGVLNWACYYKVTFLLGGGRGETEAGTISVVANPVTQSNDLSAIPVGTSGVVVGRCIYRKEEATAIYKLVTVIADNTTVTYTDNIPDVGLGAVAPSSNATMMEDGDYDYDIETQWAGGVKHTTPIGLFQVLADVTRN